MKNQGEVDVDCAGPCSTKCADGKVCGGPADCASGACAGGRCISCQDEAKNGSEADVDCGGACSTKCGNGKSCGGPADCQSGMCENQRCVATGCSDGVKNGSETDTDCGGGCPTKCTEGKRCTLPGDCQSGLCPGGTCVACLVDGVKDGQETDVDCGASCPSQCADGKVCGALADCSSGGICLNDRCQRHCGVGNGGCDADALCTNTPSGRTCVCRAGYLGDGMGCMDIDECQTGNGGCNDANAPVCVNEPGGYRCIADLEWANWSVPPETPSSYTVGVETVTDNVTGLIWQKDVVSLSFNWGDAKTYCSVISLGGQGGWRLPTLIELLSIVNSGRSDPAINTSAFPNTPSEHFWSSTPYSGSLGGAWRVYFNGGGTTFNNLSSMGRVRCVR
ncbi:MAG: DUF1566 domain-containing protein [Deltaproteobacteria bacterium]|nr:DUF1566 domain-containing protein [Deltaproteobacteria bacterium]